MSTNTPVSGEVVTPRPDKPAVGFATILGFIVVLLTGLVAPGIAELGDATEFMGVPPDLWVKVSAAVTLAVIVGRMLQAALAMWAAYRDAPPIFTPPVIEPVPSEGGEGEPVQ